MRIQQDKLSHFLAGAAILSTATLYGFPVVGLIALVVAAVGKEIRDGMGYGTPDKWDAIATILGGVVVLPYYLITQ